MQQQFFTDLALLQSAQSLENLSLDYEDSLVTPPLLGAVVEDKNPPVITTTCITEGNTLKWSATFKDEQTIPTKQYKLNDAATWTDYTEGSEITMSENGTISFRAVDAAGNEAVTTRQGYVPGSTINSFTGTPDANGDVAVVVASKVEGNIVGTETSIDEGTVELEIKGDVTGGITGSSVALEDGAVEIKINSNAAISGEVVGATADMGSNGTVALEINSAKLSGNITGLKNGNGGIVDLDVQNSVLGYTAPAGSYELPGADSVISSDVFAAENSNIASDTTIALSGDTVTAGFISAGVKASNGGHYTIDGNATLTLDNVTLQNKSQSLVYGGGHVTGKSWLRIAKDLNVNISNYTPSSVTYGGAHVEGSGSLFGLAGNLNMTIDSTGKTCKAVYAGGYVVDNGMSAIMGTVNLTINGTGTFSSYVGIGAQCVSGNFVVGGGTNLIINGSTFKSVVYAGAYSQGGAGQISGDTSLTINGGTFEDCIYGGSYAIKNNSGKTLITGNASVTINAEQDIYFGSKCDIFAGSVGYGEIGGNTKVTITGNGNYLHFAESETEEVRGICGDSRMYIANKNTYITGGTKNFTFNNFTGTLNIRLFCFNEFKATGTTSAVFGKKQDNLGEVKSWEFDLAQGNTTLTWAEGNNNFDGDTLQLNFDADLESATVIDADSASVLNGWEKFASVKFNDNTATWNGSDGYTYGEWKLSVNGSNDLILAKA